MSFLAWIAAGLLAGALSLWIPRRQSRRGCFAPLALGALGGVLGGLLATALGFGGLLGDLDPRSLVVAILAAILLLQVYRLGRGLAKRS
jgi:uncharacterized membrane protein YeaQ/YmgE (transglycosylase-associated protein family)